MHGACVICAVDHPFGDKDNVTRLYVKGTVVDKVSAAAVLHIVNFIGRMVVQSRFTVSAIDCFVEVKILYFEAYLMFHIIAPDNISID